MGNAVSGAIGVSEMFFPAVPPSYDSKNDRLVWFRTEAGSSVPAMLVLPRWVTASSRPKHSSGRRKLSDEVATICIYFHPNACDIGESVREMEVIRDGAFGGDAALLAPEYPGYGLLAEYNPSPAGIDKIAKAAWAFCCTFHGFQADQVVLWGRSIGTGPASALALRLALGGDAELRPRAPTGNGREACSFGIVQGKESAEEKPMALADELYTKRFGGTPCGSLVLMAPFMSISDVVKTHAGPFASSFVDQMWDVCAAVSDEALTEMPLCVIHPEEDEIVPKVHGEQIYARSASRRKLGVWITGEGHNLRSTVYHMKPVREFLVANIASLAAPAREAVPRGAGAKGVTGSHGPGAAAYESLPERRLSDASMGSAVELDGSEFGAVAPPAPGPRPQGPAFAL